MLPRNALHPTALAAVLTLCLGLAPHVASAQAPASDFTTSPHVLVGYVANAPNIFVGGGAMLLQPRGVGFFADVRTTWDSPSDRAGFMPGITADEAFARYGDFRTGSANDWLSINAGLTRVLTPELAVFAGAGYVQRRAFEEFWDDSLERGEFGYYWVEDDVFTGPGVNVLAGLVFRAGRNLAFQLGGELLPLGATIGVHYALPLGR
jgi:hypothetical protein